MSHLTMPTKGTSHCRIGKVIFRRSKSSRKLVEFNDTTNRLLRIVGAKP